MKNVFFADFLLAAQTALDKYEELFSSILFILIIAFGLVILGIFIYHRRFNLIQPNQTSVAEQMAKPIEEVCEPEEEVEEIEEPVHEHEFVDGVCECGEKDPNYVPEAHKVMFADIKPEESTLQTNDMAELITESISVEEAKEKIEDAVLEQLVVKANDLAKYKKAKKEKFIVNIDSISDKFNNGEVVNLESLKARNLLPKKCNYFKVLARGILDKKLTFEANDFSKDAIKMILLTGGNVVKVQ